MGFTLRILMSAVLALGFADVVEAKKPKPVTVTNFPATQAVQVTNFPAPLAVQVTNFPAPSIFPPPSALVTLRTIGNSCPSGFAVDRREMPDGTEVPFTIPPGMVLVITE